MTRELIVRTIDGKLKSFYEPFSKPNSVSNLFLLSAQRACYDRAYRWPWHFAKYNTNMRSFSDQNPLELAKWFSHVCNLTNGIVMTKFSSEMDCYLSEKLRSHFLSDKKVYMDWQENIFKHSLRREKHIKNPFLDALEYIAANVKIYQPFPLIRIALAQIFSLAVPSDSALLAIAKIAPKIFECGYASTSYWSYMLTQSGADVKCLTVGKPLLQDKVSWLPSSPIVDIRPGDYLKNNLGVFDDRALLYIWPQDTSVSRDIYWGNDNYLAQNKDFVELDYWKGDTVIFVGPEKSDPVFDPGLKYFPPHKVKGEWELQQSFEIPSWPLLNDNVKIFKRKK